MQPPTSGASKSNGEFDHERENSPVNGVAPKPKLKVALLDDDLSVLKATSRLLASAGWDVETFSDPVEFLRHAKSRPPQIVVIDILMPVMDGLEVQARLRKMSPSTRVIVMTSKDDPAVRDQAMGAGASAFFVKPVHDEEFLDGIETAASNN